MSFNPVVRPPAGYGPRVRLQNKVRIGVTTPTKGRSLANIVVSGDICKGLGWEKGDKMVIQVGSGEHEGQLLVRRAGTNEEALCILSGNGPQGTSRTLSSSLLPITKEGSKRIDTHHAIVKSENALIVEVPLKLRA